MMNEFLPLNFPKTKKNKKKQRFPKNPASTATQRINAQNPNLLKKNSWKNKNPTYVQVSSDGQFWRNYIPVSLSDDVEGSYLICWIPGKDMSYPLPTDREEIILQNPEALISTEDDEEYEIDFTVYKQTVEVMWINKKFDVGLFKIID